jgi:hypothetical protein
MKFFALLSLFFVAANATCQEPKAILMTSDETLMDRETRVSDDGNYCTYLGGDANLFVNTYSSNNRNLRDRDLTNNVCQNGNRKWKSDCRCDRDGGVDYKAIINNSGALKVLSVHSDNSIVWKAYRALRKLTNSCPDYAFVLSCDNEVAIWSLKNENNACVPDEQKWDSNGSQGGGTCLGYCP